MRLISFRTANKRSFGRVEGDQVIDLGGRWSSLRALLEADALPDAEMAAGESRPLDSVRFEPPIPDPGKILAVGLNYRQHILETGRPLPEFPSIFVRFPSAQVGHGEPIVRPAASAMFDFEGELAVVIGRGGRHLARADALRQIAGYTCFAENSVRDWQRHSQQATAGKNFDASGACGPWLVTADEIGDVAKLELATRLNGQVVQHDSLANLVFDIPHLVAYISTFTTLAPGDVIVTGTPQGVGSARKPPLWMKAGDILEVDISGIGVLRNAVVDERMPA